MNHAVQLLAYADRLGGTLAGLREVLAGPLKGFTGVHILPFFTPFDGADAGFDPVDHAAVDPRLGTWDDITALAGDGLEVVADLIVNHVSAGSVEFRDWLANGDESAHAGMFLTFGRVFPQGATEADITAFYRPRPGLPFTGYRGAGGERHLVWTTFMPTQVDLDVRHPAAQAYLGRLLDTMAGAGVTTVRVDAVGYAIKTPGTDSFMTPQTLAFAAELAAACQARGLKTLVEVHSHYSQQLKVAPLVDFVYDFATPALLLHGLASGSAAPLAEWAAIRPRNAITVLDTHDGIGIIDAGPLGDQPGLITQQDMAAIFAAAGRATGGVSDQASVTPEWFALPHQINSTFPAALADPAAYLLARAVQVCLPGVPQFYYAGLLNAPNDIARWQTTGQGREINRPVYDPAGLKAALADPVVQAQFGLIALRRNHPAFDGSFSFTLTSASAAELRWSAEAAVLTLTADLAARSFTLTSQSAGQTEVFTSVEDLAALGRRFREER